MTTPEDKRLTIINPTDSILAHVGQVANQNAARNVFTDSSSF